MLVFLFFLTFVFLRYGSTSWQAARTLHIPVLSRNRDLLETEANPFVTHQRSNTETLAISIHYGTGTTRNTSCWIRIRLHSLNLRKSNNGKRTQLSRSEFNLKRRGCLGLCYVLHLMKKNGMFPLSCSSSDPCGVILQ